MADFDWQTEEEDLFIPHTRLLLRRSRRRLWILAIGITHTLLFVLVVIWRLNHRIDSQTQQVENDVVAAFHTWQKAATNSDKDILNTLLISNSTQWMIAQRELLKSGRTLDRTMLGLPLAAELEEIVPNIDQVLEGRAVIDIGYVTVPVDDKTHQKRTLGQEKLDLAHCLRRRTFDHNHQVAVSPRNMVQIRIDGL